MSQQSKNVFVDISLWSHKWFDELPLVYQMAYLLLYAETDNVGVWKPHFRALNFRLKERVDPDDFLKKINAYSTRIEKLENGDWWMINYLKLQVKNLTPNNPPHVSYIELLIKHGLLIRYARDNPQSVNYEKIYEMECYESIKDDEVRLKTKKSFLYLKKKRLIRPLKEACEALGLSSGKEHQRPSKDSKDKEQEKEADTGRDEEKLEEQLQEKEFPAISSNGADPNSDIFGDSSL